MAKYWGNRGKDFISSLVPFKNWDQATGRLTNFSMQNGQYGVTLAHHYEWDGMGNVKKVTEQRHHNPRIQNMEQFTYDNLSRMTSSTVNSNPAVAYGYSSGTGTNIGGNLYQLGDKTLHYSPISKIHQVNLVTGPSGSGLSETYLYDEFGNATKAGDRYIAWNTQDKPVSIRRGNAEVHYKYSPSGSRYLTETYEYTQDSQARIIKSLTISLGDYEVSYKRVGSSWELKDRVYFQSGTFLSSVLERSYQNGIPNGSLMSFMAQDVRDGVISAGIHPPGYSEPEHFNYSPFGERRTSNWDYSPPGAEIPPSVTESGFGSHRQEDSINLIHMGGRIYDPEIGRFLSADPFVQDPTDAQSWNRYAYVYNNPWSHTDPTGYFSKKFFKQLLGVATAFMFPGANVFWGGFLSGASSAAINGGNILKGALSGGIGAQLARVAGHGTGPRTREFGTSAGMARHAFYGGISGGISSRIHGGSFGEGFVSGGLSSAIAKGAGSHGTGMQIVAGGVAGGVVSRIYGNSFTDGFFDGASRAAFVHVFNELKHRQAIEEDMKLFESKMLASGKRRPWYLGGSANNLLRSLRIRGYLGCSDWTDAVHEYFKSTYSQDQFESRFGDYKKYEVRTGNHSFIMFHSPAPGDFPLFFDIQGHGFNLMMPLYDMHRNPTGPRDIGLTLWDQNHDLYEGSLIAHPPRMIRYGFGQE